MYILTNLKLKLKPTTYFQAKAGKIEVGKGPRNLQLTRTKSKAPSAIKSWTFRVFRIQRKESKGNRRIEEYY